MVLTAYFVLSPATNSSCHRRWRITVCPRPVGPTCLRQLGTSNGCQDHTTLPSAGKRHSSRAPQIAHELDSPCDCHCALTLSRPPHPVPRSLRLAIRPSGGNGTVLDSH